MNKTIKIVISTILSMSMFGCGGQVTAKSSVKDDTPAISTQEEKNEEKSTNKTTVSSTLPNTYKVPLKDIYVNGPDYQQIEEGYTELFIVHNEKYCAFTSDRKSTANSLSEAHEIAFSKLQKNMVNYSGVINSISIEREEYKTIGSIDTYYFEGAINYGSNPIFDGYAVGYAFILDGVPCEIIGSVIDDEQSSVTIQEIKDNVDAMMQSVRTTK